MARRNPYWGGPPPMFPPDRQAYGVILYLKAEGEKALQQNNLQAAMDNYNRALNLVDSFRFIPFICEEFHKLICNRSLVNLKMGHYKEAEKDALHCIQVRPDFVKAYWRAAQAAKNLPNGIPRALEHIMAGLRNLVVGQGNTEDIISFFTDLCIVIPMAPTTRRVSDILGEIICILPESTDPLWEKVVVHLSSGGHWESLSMLLIGRHSGPHNDLESYCLGEVNCRGISVGKMLNSISEHQLKTWGIQLAVMLLNSGAQPQEIAHRFGKPLLHVGVKLSLQTENLDLLKYMLLEVPDSSYQIRNATDSDGQTVFHILILSGKIHTTCGEAVLRLLLNHKCNAGIPDKQGRRPFDLLKSTDSAYMILKKAVKTVEELRKDLETLKSHGNSALKSGNDSQALRLYSEALEITKNYKELNKEAAILYSNRANVLNKQQKFEEAMQNATAAISCDATWHKGYYWKGVTQKNLCNIPDALGTFLVGYRMTTTEKQEEKTDFVVEAVLLLLQLQGEQLKVSYQQLINLGSECEVWPSVLTKLSRSGEWRCIALLIFGPDLEKTAKKRHNGDTLKSVCNGVASKASTHGVQMSSVFQYLPQNNLVSFPPWLDAVVYAVYKHGDEETLKSLCVGQKDTPLHAAVRFSLITGKMSLLDELTSKKKTFSVNFANADGDTLFHEITKLFPPPTTPHLMEVADLLLKKGYSAMVRDRHGKLPVEYLNNSYPGEVFDVFFKASRYTSTADILHLKETGNELFIAGRVIEAIQHYTKAINLVEASGYNAGLTNHDLAVLYGNRAEAFLKMEAFNEALEDARESVGYDGHWFKAHRRVGRILRGQGQFEYALRALINSYKDIDKNEDEEIRIEVMLEIISVCVCIPRNRVDCLKRLPEFPRGQGHLWAKVAYKLISAKNNWDLAAIAYFQFKDGEAVRSHIVFNLRPLCNLPMLAGYAWGTDLMKFFLISGSDRNTMQIEKGQPYLHTAVLITLKLGISAFTSFLQFILENYACKYKEQNKVDTLGNTALHVATKEKGIHKDKRFQVIVMLLTADVDPTIVNMSGLKAVDLLPKEETKSLERLRMAMYSTANRASQPKTSQQKGKQSHSKDEKENRAPKILKRPEQRGCQYCEECLTEGEQLLKSEDVKEGYRRLVDLMSENHRSEKHLGLVRKAVQYIISKLGESSVPGIPNCLGEIKGDNLMMIVDGLANKNKWGQLDTFVRKYRLLNSADSLKNFASTMSIVPMLRDSSLQNSEDMKLQILKTMIGGGATLGSDGGQSALRVATECEHYKVIGELIKLGADTSHLSFTPGDTPIHAIMAIVLDKDKSYHEKLNLLKIALKKFEEDPKKHSHLNPDQVDQNGDSLFHMVAKAKYNTVVLSATELLCKHNVSSSVYNNDQKMPSFYIKKQTDRRLQFIKLAAKVQAKPSVKKEKIQEESSFSDQPTNIYNKDSDSGQHEIKEVVKISSQREIWKKNIEEKIRLLPDSKISIFNIDTSVKQSPADRMSEKGDNWKDIEEKGAEQVKNSLRSEFNKDTVVNDKGAVNDMGPDNESFKNLMGRKEGHQSLDDCQENILEGNQDQLKGDEVDVDRHAPQVPKARADIVVEDKVDEVIGDVRGDDAMDDARKDEVRDDVMADVRGDETRDDVIDSEESDSEDTEEEFVIDAQVFDNLEWEVECTAEVWKTLRDKHVVRELKLRIVRKIQLLASGEWQPHLCKKLKNVPPTLNLFEAKFSKGSRIMWELAVAFSPRCSETAERRLQPDEGGEVTNPVRGGRIYSEIIRVWDIVLDHDKIFRSVERIRKSHLRGEHCIIQKKLRGIKSDSAQVSRGKRYPALYAECDVSNEILQQYFPPASANEAEYHILKFYSFSSALVSHVLQNIEAKVDFPFRVTDLEHAIINLRSQAPILLLGRSGTGKTTCCLYRLWSQFHTYWSKAKEADAPLLPRCIEFVHHEEEPEDIESGEEDENVEEEEDRSESESEPTERASEADQSESCVEQQVGQIYDHIHQIFITKNAVLCSEVQKNFRELSHADDLMQDHVAREEENIPYRLQDVNDYLFPLFLTSRQLMLMLDASLGPPYFFERKEDGSLKVDIGGWTDTDGPLSILPLLDEDSDVEEEQFVDDESDSEDDTHQAGARKKTKVDPRREITYEVFVDEVWPRTKKKIGSSYHPSLVWMEIMSFIKGSYEALTKRSGYLQKEEYFKLGRKRASNFSGEREKIYQFFHRYQHFKSQNSLFDETDLVHDVFRRLRMMETRPWVIHQIFVDETQDFTQAELCLLIRLCQNPNDMFLTGDTAQSIMRGIAFRFSDLRSLFYHAKMSMQEMGKTSTVKVPKQVYQLTHNYRSHAGILSLASSVLELMVEFFPESFDRLRKDQGLFHGPQPILLESCSFSDLAVLLRGNRRKTSHIEFGAHQAILVVNDAAREAIPEELRLGLVLTIYEAKGLEFDDVLLYNFFKDSQAGKEWRVVTDYLERLHQGQTESTQHQESLAEIDESVLKQEDRPRPLEFDPNLHKVLNSELKHLYTALTRARVNVWIFDEDLDKRAPMFEFFKARKLVKCLTVSEINEKSLSETMFAEKSSPTDWVKRGEDFMRHSLYSVAAKCFGMGGDLNRQKVAVAHGQALQASRLKDNPRKMREEFLHAAELYLDCNKLAKAAVCLQNAREKELSAQLYEKSGQYERAAEVYRKMKRPMASSRCYELLGQFSRALQVLYENENFDMAIDTLRRYNMLMEDLRQSGASIPPQLIEYKPDEHFTEQRLSYRAAEHYHRYSNEERMLDSLSRIELIDDRVRFLTDRGYMKRAADILEETGEGRRAAMVMLKCGKIDDAVSYARKTLQEDIIAQCLLAHSRVIMSRGVEEHHKQGVIENLEEAVGMLETCKDMTKLGEAHLHLAELKNDVAKVELAWKAFASTKPFQNEAGLVECTDWLIQHDKLNIIGPMKSVVKGVGHLFNVCNVLLDLAGQANLDKSRLFDEFYGLSSSGPDALQVNWKEKPICRLMIKDLLKDKRQKKNPLIEVTRLDAHEAIVGYLLRRASNWLIPIWQALGNAREKCSSCEFIVCGLNCPQKGNVEKPCKKLHKTPDHENFRKLIAVDILMVEFEFNVQSGAQSLLKKCRTNLRQAVENFLYPRKDPVDIRYQAAKTLWDDIMPAIKYPACIGDEKKFIRYLTSHENEKVRHHMYNFIKETWQVATTGDKKLKSSAAKSTDVFLLLDFGSRVFRLTESMRNLDRIEPTREITKLEDLITAEVKEKKDPKVFEQRIKHFYTLMSHTDKITHRHFVQCFARRFSEAYNFMSGENSDPWEAVYKFSKFCHLLNTRGDSSFLPDLKHFLFWVEFYCTIAFFTIAKVNYHEFPDFVFIVPENYMSVVKFVEATFPRYTVEQVIAWWKPRKFSNALEVQERLKYIVWLISGLNTGVKLYQEKFKNPVNPDEFAIAERLLILGMTLVCNVGKTVPLECEISLVKEICKLSSSDQFPARLQRAVISLRNARGIKAVADTLRTLLKERDNEFLIVCQWSMSGKIEKIRQETLKSDLLFSENFLNTKTIPMLIGLEVMMAAPEFVKTNEEGELSDDEIEKGRKDQEAHRQLDKKHKAATTIARHVRKFLKRKHQERSAASGCHTFDAIQVDATMCGICGVSFEHLLKDFLESEQDRSDWASGHRQNSEENVGKEGTTPTPPSIDLSLDSTATMGDNSPSVKGTFGWVSSKVPFLQNPTTSSVSSQPWKDSNQPVTDQEYRQKLLETIRNKHLQDQKHVQKKFEFLKFKRDYIEKILPSVTAAKEFMYKPEYELKALGKDNYIEMRMDITRIFGRVGEADSMLELILDKKSWSDIGRLEQISKEISSDFERVRPYVIEIFTAVKKKEEEEQARAEAYSSSATTMHGGEDWDEEMELQQVVKEPRKFRKKEYRNKKHRNARR